MKVRFVFGIVFSLLALSSAALAQNYRGSVRGRVTDSNGASVKGAKVSLVDQDTNQTRTGVSNEVGEYAFLLLRPGAYRLQVEQTGFKRASENLIVRVNQEARLDIIMAIGGLQADPIIVSDSASPLKQDGASLGAV
ncbi:MAG TPA: carboxypeptidase-like regulatory domain-containing protein, partial [Blastocatellia bacterium]|nr:carboxypeptidase-like regulatory domain-containing protein [Blastocatellia bacterium]